MIDGIGDYCERLESALRTAGADARTLAVAGARDPMWARGP